jgi:ribosome biogenesis GTPase A
MLGKLLFLHILMLNKNDILKTAIENQYKNFFYRNYELWDMVTQSNKDLE